MQIELWQIHASTMIIALSMVILIVIVAHFFKTRKWWLKVHRVGASLASLVLLIGISGATYMVATTSGIHLAYPHTWFGLVTVVLAFITTAMGYGRMRGSIKMDRATYRKVHITSAAALVVSMLITVYMGFGLVFGF